MDDAYLGGERPGGMADRGSENKIPIVAAFSLNEAGYPILARITAGACKSAQARYTSRRSGAAAEPALVDIKHFRQ